MTGPRQGEPRVSIIIPTYNRQQFIAKAIESALEQGPNVEVIVVDDGSTDSSPSIIASFPDIRLVRIANAGPSAARNAGLQLARGGYVRFLDSDDRLPVGSTSALLEAANVRSEREIVFGDAALIDASGIPTTGIAYGYADQPPGPIPTSMLFSRPMQAWLPLWPLSALRDAGGFNEALWIGEDYELAAKVSRLGHSFVHVPEHSYEVREHGDHRLSRRYGAPGYRAHLDMFEKVWEIVGPAASMDERQAIGKMAWSLGRGAARERLQAESEALFAFAHRLAKRRAQNAPVALKIAYQLATPFAAERAAEAVKALLPGFSTGRTR